MYSMQERSTRVLLALVLAVTGIAADGKSSAPPPYERLLKGEDAQRAIALEKRIEERRADDDHAGVLRTAEELLELRQRVQGVDHYEVATLRSEVVLFRRLTALSEDQRNSWREAREADAEAARLEQRGRPGEALPPRERFLRECCQLLGEDHPLTASGYQRVAMTLNAQGKAGAAAVPYRKALEIRRRALGEEHPDTARSYDGLASNLQDLGRSAEAEPLFRKALEIRRRALGEEHHHTASSYHNVATNLKIQGKVTSAEPYYRQALELHRRHLGEEHPHTAFCYAGLAANLQAQGKAGAAEPLYQKALEIRRRVLGEGHPHTATSYDGAAANLQALGQPTAAEALFRKALEIRRKALGDEHPETLTSYNNLAYHLSHRGRPAEAEPLYRHALEVRRRVLGDDHPSTALSYNNMAMNLGDQGKTVEAEPLIRQALEIRRRLLGEEHPHTANSYHNLAANLYGRGQYDAAGVALGGAQRSFETSRLRSAAAGIESALFTVPSPYPLLAAHHARAGQPLAAWEALELYFGRGLLTERSVRRTNAWRPEEETRRRQLQQQRDQLHPDILALARRRVLSDTDRTRLDGLLGERRTAETELADLAVRVALREVAPLADVRSRLPEGGALLAWLDITDKSGQTREHWACVVRRTGDPVWVKLPGTGAGGVWIEEDSTLHRHLRQELLDPAARPALSEALYAQRIRPLEPHLQGVRQLIVLPAGWMSAVPVEALTDRWTVSYAPSATLYTQREPAPRSSLTLLAVGDPAYRQAVTQTTTAPLTPGDYAPLPGTRREVSAISGLFSSATALLGAEANPRRLEEMAAKGELIRFRYLHLAAHGAIDPTEARKSALVLAPVGLPDPREPAPARWKPHNGRLTVADILDTWELDADLVVLSACETGLGPQGGGEGLMGFAQALLSRGARSLVVSLWPVDDAATALLMVRFYQNLLGKRDGLEKPLPRAEALREAKHWLRELSTREMDEALTRLPKVERGGERVRRKVTGDAPKPFSHPYYWSAFILIGDPE